MSTIDEKGNVLPEVLEILKIAKEKKLAICSGHIGAEENVALSKKTKDMEIPFFVNHALSEERPYGMPVSKLKECAENGAYIGTDVMHTLPSFYSPFTDAEISVNVIQALGAKQCILVSDVGQVLNWDPLGGLRMVIRVLLGYGIPRDDIRQMFVINPRKFLGLSS